MHYGSSDLNCSSLSLLYKQLIFDCYKLGNYLNINHLSLISSYKLATTMPINPQGNCYVIRLYSMVLW